MPFSLGRPNDSTGQPRSGCGCSPRLLIALVVGAISLISYFSLSSTNPFTGQTQHVALTQDQEIALGLQAAPEMMQMHGGSDASASDQAKVAQTGQRLVQAVLELHKVEQPVYQFDFHLLADPQTVNAFALPGGQIFITRALYDRLATPGQLAGVLGHEIGHVIHRHGAEHLATQQLTQGLAGAAVIAAYDPNRPGSSDQAAMIAQAVGALVNMKYGRDDELESDAYGIAVLAQAGYDPRAMIDVMHVLEAASAGGSARPEWTSTHPNPGNRIAKIEEAIAQHYPQGVPPDLER